MFEIAGGIIIAVAVIGGVLLFLALLGSQDGRDMIKIVTIPLWAPVALVIECFSNKKLRNDMLGGVFALVMMAGFLFFLAYNLIRPFRLWVKYHL